MAVNVHEHHPASAESAAIAAPDDADPARDAIIVATLRWEGGFVDHPADRGGVTNWGITQATYEAWFGRPVSVADMRLMPQSTALAIYRSAYWRPAGCDRLPELIRPVVFDMAVNHGPARAIAVLQGALSRIGAKTTIDGRLGPQTLAKVEEALTGHGARLINAICDQRWAFYRAIVAKDPSQAVFARGWRSRCDSFRQKEADRVR